MEKETGPVDAGGEGEERSSTPTPSVHCLWDWDSLPCTHTVPMGTALTHIQTLAERHGKLEQCTILTSQPFADPAQLAVLQERGVRVEHVLAHAGGSLLERLLHLTLQLQQQAPASDPSHSRPSVIVLSNQPALAPSLALMRSSGLFAAVILMHGPDASKELRQSASSAAVLEEAARESALPRVRTPEPLQMEPSFSGAASSFSAQYSASSPMSCSTNVGVPQTPPSEIGAQFSHLSLRMSPMLPEDSLTSTSILSNRADSLLGAHPALSTQSALAPSPRNQQHPLLPTPSPQHLSSAAAPFQPGGSISALSPNLRFHSHSTVPSPQSSAGGGSSSKVFGFGIHSARSHTTPSSPALASSVASQSQLKPHARSFFPSTLSPSQSGPQQPLHSPSHGRDGGFFRSVSSGSVSSGAPSHHHGHRHSHSFGSQSSLPNSGTNQHPHSISNARCRACVLAYQKIITYCEQEKLIPRESVLKKRLVDSRADLGHHSSGGSGGGSTLGGVDFEDFLFIITQVTQVGVMEGEAPQRIVWPRGNDGAPRRFACADFFTPQARLTPAQNSELMEFLYRVQPEVERGRFGFATYLAHHGPHFIQLLPHGVLVELVQLLLNRKVLLFRKGKVSVASRSEAMEAQTLGHFFTAENFLTPAQSRAPSPAQPSYAALQQPPSSALEAGHEQNIWNDDNSALGSRLFAPTTATPADEASIWASPAQPTMLSSGALRRNSIGGSPLYSPASYPPPVSNSRLGQSYSMPVSRTSSPVRGSPPESFGNRFDPLPFQPAQQHSGQPLYGLGEPGKFATYPQPLKSSLQSLAPMHSRSIFEQSHTVMTAGSEPVQQQYQQPPQMTSFGVDSTKPPPGLQALPWLKPETTLTTAPPSGSSSVSASVAPSRRSSLSELEHLSGGSNLVPGSQPWQSHQSEVNAAIAALTAQPLRFEPSTGFAGEAQDACDPAAVLSAKLAQLNRSTLESIGPAGTSLGPNDELARFSAAMQFRAAFHYEKSGAAHTPEWLAVLTFCVTGRKYTMASSMHSKKDAAKADVAMRALTAIEENTLVQVPHVELVAEAQGQPDAVLDLARLLNFLQQAPVVYYLARTSMGSALRGSGASVGGRSGMESHGRRASTGQLGHHSRQPSYGMWSANARIQVKSVNVITGEAQPTVSASTPFSHSVQGIASKLEAKQLVAASLLQQIEKARVVNPALFTVLSAAHQPVELVAARSSSVAASRTHSPTPSHGVTSSSSSAVMPLDSIWSSAPSQHSQMAPISAPSHLPPVDIGSCIGARPSVSHSVLSGATPSASLFSLHTPVAGRPFSGISAIGLATPRTGEMTPSTPAQQTQPPAHSGLNLTSMLRTLSEEINEDTHEVSNQAAESALHETPKNAST